MQNPNPGYQKSKAKRNSSQDPGSDGRRKQVQAIVVVAAACRSNTEGCSTNSWERSRMARHGRNRNTGHLLGSKRMSGERKPIQAFAAVVLFRSMLDRFSGLPRLKTSLGFLPLESFEAQMFFQTYESN